MGLIFAGVVGGEQPGTALSILLLRPGKIDTVPFLIKTGKKPCTHAFNITGTAAPFSGEVFSYMPSEKDLFF